MAVSFKGAHFPPEVILMGVRWYLAYPLSTRHVEELMEERGINVDPDFSVSCFQSVLTRVSTCPSMKSHIIQGLRRSPWTNGVSN
jgi:transposase-like protein